MTVAELIAHLQQFPQDMEVIGYYDGRWGYGTLTTEDVYISEDLRLGDTFVAIEI